MGLERMLRIHLLQHWFKLANAACEEGLYASAPLGAFAGIDLGRAPAPDATTILKFRHLLERHNQAVSRRLRRLVTSVLADVQHPTTAGPNLAHLRPRKRT